jgi:hypothetical protein
MGSVGTQRVTGWAYGVPLSLSPGAAAREAVLAAVPTGWRAGDVPGGTRSWEIVSAADVVPVLAQVELYVAERAPGLVFVHAGVVVVGGRAVLLPGRSMAGKSTLTEALVRAGATYYSDEFALLDEDARVRPYPRALALRTGTHSRARRIPVSELGPGSGEAVPVGLVAQLVFDATRGWRVETLSPARTALALIDNAVAARSRTAEVLERCVRAASTSVGLAGTRGEAGEAAWRLVDAVCA